MAAIPVHLDEIVVLDQDLQHLQDMEPTQWQRRDRMRRAVISMLDYVREQDARCQDWELQEPMDMALEANERRWSWIWMKR